MGEAQVLRGVCISYVMLGHHVIFTLYELRGRDSPGPPPCPPMITSAVGFFVTTFKTLTSASPTQQWIFFQLTRKCTLKLSAFSVGKYGALFSTWEVLHHVVADYCLTIESLA